MSDLISREEVLREFTCLSDDAFVINHKIQEIVKKLPSVEPERKPGKWIDYPFENVYGQKLCDYRCNLCAYFVNAKTKFCPNCGSKMEVDNE